MNKENNFEDVFKNAFEGFEGEPSKDVWNTIAKDREMKQKLGLTEQTPESVFSKVFQNFTSNPSSGVWFGVKDYLLKKIFYRRLKYLFYFLLFGGGVATLYYNLNTPSKTSSSSTYKSNLSELKPIAKKDLANDNIQVEPINLETSSNTNFNSNNNSNIKVSGSYQNLEYKNPFETYSKSTESAKENNSTNVDKVNEKIEVVDVVEADNNKIEEANSEPKNIVDSAASNTSNQTQQSDISKYKNSKKKDQTKDNKKVNNYVKYTKETDINNEEAKYKIGFMAGIDYGNFTLKGGNELYTDVRKNQELFRPTSFHSGITFSYMIDEHWYIQTNGIFANQAMNIAYNKKVVKPDTTRDALGNITKIENKVLFNVDTTAHYAFSTLEIPLMIGYRFGDKRWTFHAMAGPEWSLIISKRGSMLSANSMKVESIENNNIPTVKQIWGMWLALGGSYQISHQYSLTIEPIFRYKFNSIFNSNYPVKQYNYATGINFGIRYHFD